MSTWHRWTLIAALAATPACDSCASKTSSPAPTKPPAGSQPAARATKTAKAKSVSRADEGRWIKRVELAEDFAALVDDNAGDCAKLAAAIETWTADHEKELAEELARDEELSDSAKDVLRDRYDERSKKADETVQEALASCKDDPAVTKAMAALPDDKR